MVRATDTLTIEWVDLDRIRWDDQPIDEAQVEFYAGLFAGNDDHLTPPMLNADMTVRDGRHRLKAHQRVGRTRARCLIVH